MIQRLVSKFRQKDGDTRTVLLNMAGAFGVKGLAMVVQLLTVPAFISYFDNNAYLGVWYTIWSVVMWFMTFDFGIANGIRNRLVRHIIDKNHEGTRSIISSGLMMSILASLTIGLAAVPLILAADWNSIFSISREMVAPEVLRESMLWLLATILLRLVLVAVNAIFYALQLSSVNNLLTLLSSTLIYIFILCFRFDTPEQALRGVAVANAVLFNLPVAVAGVIVFARRLRYSRPRWSAVNRKAAKDIFSLGGGFFYCQILFTVITCSDQFLITKFFGADFTVDYTFYYRLTSMLGTVVALATTPLWSMITKAMEQKKYKWLTSLFSRLQWAGAAVLAVEFLFAAFLQPIMNIWLGSDTITVCYITASAFAVYGSLFILNNLLATFACGLGKLREQIVWYTIGVVAKFAIILGLKERFPDWNLVIWADVVAFAPYVVIQYIVLRRYFKRLKRDSVTANDISSQNIS